MASRVIMPKLTDSMEEGVVVKWRKAEGDHVESGDVLAEIETDKAVMDLEAFASGTLRKILVPEGATVPSGALIGVIAEPDEDIQAIVKQAPAPVQKPVPEKKIEPEPDKGSAAEAQAVASPRARTLARTHGFDLSTVKGSGPGGRIVERDIEPLLSKKTAGQVSEQPAGRDVPLSQMRKAIVRMTMQSKAPIPHYYVTIDADMDEAHRFVEESKRQTKIKHISLSHLVTAACARALAQHPGVNAMFAGESIKLLSTIDIGVAVALDDGLIVPVLRDCGSKTLEQLAEAQRTLVARAQSRTLKPEEYTGATFLISNLGMYGIESFIAVILPPAAAVLAVGSLRETPVVRGGKIEAGRRVKLTLSCDHRVIDGAVAAQFLQTLEHGLEHPAEL